MPGLSALAEYTHQGHADQDVSAPQPGTRSSATPRASCRGRPSLTYRYASFSGDDPDTARREAFDAPLSSGLDEWVQGVVFKKVVTDGNVNSHRVRFNLAPSQRLNYTIDWFRLMGRSCRRRPARRPLRRRDRLRGAVGDLEALVLASAWPASRGRTRCSSSRPAGVAKPWATVQASLFWGF